MSSSNATKKRYNDRLKVYGYDPKTLGWIKGKQGIRFNVLTTIGSMKNCSILDVGCGFGDLYGFLKYMNIDCNYQGFELNPNLIKIAKKRYPKIKIQEFDINKNNINRKFDWIIISGLFNFKNKNKYKHIEKILKKLFTKCNKGIAVDFLSTYVEYREKNANYFSPEKIFKISKSLSKRITIRHDYMPFEFCLYIYKNDKITNDVSFKEHKTNLKKELKTNEWLKKI